MFLSGSEIFNGSRRVSRLHFAPAFVLYLLFAVALPYLKGWGFWEWLLAHTAVNICLESPVVRRLHDLNLSGANMAVCFLPGLGAAYWLCLALRRGMPGVNRYGVDPARNRGSSIDYRSRRGQ